MKDPGPTESELHKSVAHFLDWVLLPPALWTTFPSGWGVFTPMLAQRLKKSGLKAGMPDMLIFYQGLTIGIELKARKNKESAEQRTMFRKLAEAGVTVFICRSVDDVEFVLREVGLPMRSTTGTCLQEHRKEPVVATYAKRAGLAAGSVGVDNG